MSASKKDLPPINLEAERCQGCLICMMRCGFRFEKLFSPRASKIKVVPCLDGSHEIYFTDGCDRCGICARHCPSGALSVEKQSAF